MRVFQILLNGNCINVYAGSIFYMNNNGTLIRSASLHGFHFLKMYITLVQQPLKENIFVSVKVYSFGNISF